MGKPRYLTGLSFWSGIPDTRPTLSMCVLHDEHMTKEHIPGPGQGLQLLSSVKKATSQRPPSSLKGMDRTALMESPPETLTSCQASCGAYLRQSMWMHWGALYSPWLSFWNPISWYMFSPWKAALASTNGLGTREDEQAHRQLSL